MTRMLAIFTPPVIMAMVSGIAGLLAVLVATRPGDSEQSVYARRIVGTMLATLAIILGGFAWSLWSWSMPSS
jgi:hypothetical protein